MSAPLSALLEDQRLPPLLDQVRAVQRERAALNLLKARWNGGEEAKAAAGQALEAQQRALGLRIHYLWHSGKFSRSGPLTGRGLIPAPPLVAGRILADLRALKVPLDDQLEQVPQAVLYEEWRGDLGEVWVRDVERDSYRQVR